MKLWHLFKFGTLLGICLLNVACATSADSIYLNGKIYTVDSDQPWAEAFAIKDGRFIEVGTNDAMNLHKGEKTQITDLEGRMVMPGIYDAHIHPVTGAESVLFQCDLSDQDTKKKIRNAVKSCAEDLDEGEWIRGGQWPYKLLSLNEPPRKDFLDALGDKNPIYLIDSSLHAAWLNTRALEEFGINKETPNPDGGTIVKDPVTGEPTGVLLDSALSYYSSQLPNYSPQQYEEAVKWIVAKMNSYGVVAMKDAASDVNKVKAYQSLSKKNELNMRIAASLRWDPDWPQSTWSQEVEQWQAYKTDRVNTAFVKLFLDGIPPARTAAFLEPYLSDEKHGDNFHGELLYDNQDIFNILSFLSKSGMTVKMHAAGDASVRQALDAVEHARKIGDRTDLMHEIAHASVISPEDFDRFSPLNVVADLAPILYYPTPLVDAMVMTLGKERAYKFWPMKTFQENNVRMVYGSDWPSVSPSPSPWAGIEAMITRKNPYTNRGEELWGEQSLNLPAVLEIFTLSGATALGLEDKAGRIARGKSADFIVIDQNIFDVDASEISETRVLQTTLAGEVVFLQN